jgi:hypothetical protein
MSNARRATLRIRKSDQVIGSNNGYTRCTGEGSGVPNSRCSEDNVPVERIARGGTVTGTQYRFTSNSD